MSVQFIKVGQDAYVNTRYITRIEEAPEFLDSAWIHTIDGKYIESEPGFTVDKVMSSLNKANTNPDTGENLDILV